MSNVVSLPEATLSVTGHWMYVRQCKKPAQYPGTGIFRPGKDERVSHVCEVLAVGPKVGTKRTSQSRRWCRLRRIPRHIAADYAVGDFVLLPENSPCHLLKVSPYHPCEFFVDESVILAKVST